MNIKKKPKFIAEVSSNHNRNLNRCYEYINPSNKNRLLLYKISIVQD